MTGPAATAPALPTPAQLIAWEESLVGRLPYFLGATVGDTAALRRADCSSFQQRAFTVFGINIPRTADSQWQATRSGGGLWDPSGSWYTFGRSIDLSTLVPGALVFMGGWDDATNPPGLGGIQHVAMYVGGGNVIEEGGAENNVNVCPLSAFGDHVLYATLVDGLEYSMQPITLIPSPAIGTVVMNADHSARRLSDGSDLDHVQQGVELLVYFVYRDATDPAGVTRYAVQIGADIVGIEVGVDETFRSAGNIGRTFRVIDSTGTTVATF